MTSAAVAMCLGSKRYRLLLWGELLHLVLHVGHAVFSLLCVCGKNSVCRTLLGVTHSSMTIFVENIAALHCDQQVWDGFCNKLILFSDVMLLLQFVDLGLYGCISGQLPLGRSPEKLPILLFMFLSPLFVHECAGAVGDLAPCSLILHPFHPGGERRGPGASAAW